MRPRRHLARQSVTVVCVVRRLVLSIFFFFQAEDGIRDVAVTGVQTCALPICVQRSGASMWGSGALRGDAIRGAARGEKSDEPRQTPAEWPVVLFRRRAGVALEVTRWCSMA